MLENSKGSALVLCLVFLTVLMMMGGWYAYQSACNIKIAAGLMRYKIAFRGSLGSLRLGLFSMMHDTPRILMFAAQGNHTPYSPFMYTQEETYVKEDLELSLLHKVQIKYLRKFPQPPPGWMLNAQGGQTKFFSLHYKISGPSSFNNKSNSNISGLVVLVTNKAKII